MRSAGTTKEYLLQPNKAHAQQQRRRAVKNKHKHVLFKEIMGENLVTLGSARTS